MRAGEVDRLMRVMADGQHALVHWAGLRAAGVSPRSIRRRTASPHWEPVSERVIRLAGAPVTDEQQALAAVLDAGPGAVLSHRSAAALWSLPGFAVRPVSVSRPRSARSLPVTLAQVHHCSQLPDDHCGIRLRVPVTTLARTVGDLIATEHLGRAERALQAALRIGMRWSALEDVAEVVLSARRPGARAWRILRERHHGREVTGSGLECRFLEILRAAALPEPRRQVDVGGGHWIGRVDFLYDDVRLVVEIDGLHWHDGAVDAARDRRRNAELVAHGFAVLPIAERLILDAPDEVARLVRSALSRPRDRGGPEAVTAAASVRGGRRRPCSSGPGGVG